jgi:hypothetical protein
MNRDENSPLFVEEQRFTQGWLWAVIVAMDALVCLPFLSRLSGLGQHTGAGEALSLLGGPVICLGITALFIVLKLVTRIDASGISVRFTPFHRRPLVFRREDISEGSVRTYRPIAEYGGWGIKRGRAGLAYSVSGNQGLQLVLADGRRVLIGTQRPVQMAVALSQALKSEGA